MSLVTVPTLVRSLTSASTTILRGSPIAKAVWTSSILLVEELMPALCRFTQIFPQFQSIEIAFVLHFNKFI